MKHNKWIGMALAMLLVFSLAATALAADTDPPAEEAVDMETYGQLPIDPDRVIKGPAGTHANPYRISIDAILTDEISLKAMVKDYLEWTAGGTDQPPRYGEYYVSVTSHGAMYLVRWSQTESLSLMQI